MADQVHRTLPSVFPYFFSLAYMLPPSEDIHHWGFPPSTHTHTHACRHTHFLTPSWWDLRELWMESFSSHMTLSPRRVFCRCWATHSSHRAPLFLQRGDTKATFEAHSAARCRWNTRHNKRPCCVCDEWPDRETRHWPLVMEPLGPDEAAQLCPHPPPTLHFYTLHCTLWL